MYKYHKIFLLSLKVREGVWIGREMWYTIGLLNKGSFRFSLSVISWKQSLSSFLSGKNTSELKME